MVNKLIKFRNYIFIGRIVKGILLLIGIDIPREVKIGKNVLFPHNSVGTVIHPNTEIGNNVTIYQNVTVGRADIYLDFNESNMEEIIIEDDVILCAGCKVLTKDKKLRIGKRSIIAANAVLLNSTGEGEIWAGVPAKKIGMRR